MNNNSEDHTTVERQSNSSPKPSETQTQNCDLLGSDQATLSGGSYQSANSTDTNLFITHQFVDETMSSVPSVLSYKPPTNTTAPNASVLKHLTKLSFGNFVSWKIDLEIHLVACGLGGFILFKIPQPNVAAEIPLWRMHCAQVLLAMRTTINGHNLNSISGSQHPHDAMAILS